MEAPGGLNRSMHVVSDYEASALQSCRGSKNAFTYLGHTHQGRLKQGHLLV